MRILGFATIVLTALALVPGGAHLLALPNKIDLPQDAYFTAQGVYRGWALLGAVLLADVAALIAWAFAARAQRNAFRLALLAGLCLITALVVFFLWTFPANQATANWTVVPDDWMALRRDWEFSHAAGAMLELIALVAVTASVIAAVGSRGAQR